MDTPKRVNEAVEEFRKLAPMFDITKNDDVRVGVEHRVVMWLRTTLLALVKDVERETLRGVVGELNNYVKHAKGYRDDDSPLAKENKSGWNAAMTYFEHLFHAKIAALKAKE